MVTDIHAHDPAPRGRYIARTLNARLPTAIQDEIEAEYAAVARAQSAAGRDSRLILLVGGAGYVGSVVAGHLLECGYRVRCLDLLLYRNGVSVAPYFGHPNYQFVYGDLADASIHDPVLDGVTDVVLLAGLVGDPITKKYPDASNAINDSGMGHFINALNGRRLNRVLFISTCSNYGLIPEDATASEDHELTPLSLYAEAKVRNEQLLLDRSRDVDYEPTVLRFATAFGPSSRMRFDLTVNEFTRDMHLRKDLLVFDAHTWRPYCHTGDFSRAIRRALELGHERVGFEVFNCGGENNNCTKQMIVDKILARVPDAPVSYKEHGGDPRNYRVNFDKIRTRLLFEPKWSVDDGVMQILQALGNHLYDEVENNRPFYGNYELDYTPPQG